MVWVCRFCSHNNNGDLSSQALLCGKCAFISSAVMKSAAAPVSGRVSTPQVDLKKRSDETTTEEESVVGTKSPILLSPFVEMKGVAGNAENAGHDKEIDEEGVLGRTESSDGALALLGTTVEVRGEKKCPLDYDDSILIGSEVDLLGTNERGRGRS